MGLTLGKSECVRSVMMAVQSRTLFNFQLEFRIHHEAMVLLMGLVVCRVVHGT